MFASLFHTEPPRRGDFVILRSRFQPVTRMHEAAIKHFFKKESKRFATRPHLVLAIVGDLLRHTKLGDELRRFGQDDDSKYLTYLERHKRALNPLTVFSVADDLATLVADLPTDWRKRIRITLMPDFACTMWAKRVASQLSAEAYGILTELLPDNRSWLVPLLDHDDASDVSMAKESGEEVIPIDSDILSHAISVRFDIDKKSVGLYAYATYCLIKHTEEKRLSDLLPAPVRERWEREGVFARVRNAARLRAGDNLDALLETLLSSQNVAPLPKNGNGEALIPSLGDFFRMPPV